MKIQAANNLGYYNMLKSKGAPTNIHYFRFFDFNQTNHSYWSWIDLKQSCIPTIYDGVTE